MRTITSKLTRIYMVVAVSVLFISSSVSQIYFYLHARTIAHENLNTQAAAMAGNLESAVTFSDASFAQLTLNAMRHYHDVSAAAVILPDGQYFAKYSRDRGNDIQNSLHQFGDKNEFMTSARHGVIQNIAQPSGGPARLLVVASMERINQKMLLTLGASTLIAGVILAAAYTIFRRMSLGVTRPIEDLTSLMRTVEHGGDQGQRARFISDDEIGELAIRFNAMLAALEKNSISLTNELEERKKIEAEILGTRNQLQATVDAVPDLMFEIGLDGSYYDFHSPRTDLLSAPPETLVGRTVSDVLPANAAEVCLSALREANENGHASGMQFELPLPQGARWFELSVARKQVSPGDEARFIVLSRDVTERKSAELAQLESELRFRAIIEATPVALALNDDQGNITYLNQAFLRTIGYTTQDIPTLADWWPRAYPDPQYRQWVAENWFNATDEARENGVFTPLEVTVRCKDGATRTLMISATPLADSAIGTNLIVMYDITERKAAEEAVKNLALYDTLTGLPNRRLLLERLKKAMASSARNERYNALMFIDLDNFKTLNDTRGHDIGDMLLQQVAQRLTCCVRECDTVARLGGDEFVIMLEGLSENMLDAATQAETLGEKVLVSLNQTYQLADCEYRNTPSIGVTLFTNRHGSVDELLKRADLAMYQAKAAGRNTMRFFDPVMQAAFISRATMEAELREAVIGNQFLLYYQPQVDGNGHLAGSEALLRWQHPKRGLVLPSEFIPLAEETRLILPLGQWVLKTACAQLAHWATRSETSQITIAINVSAYQFRQPHFVDQVLATLQDVGANPQNLKLELTESLLVSDTKEVVEKMVALKGAGVRLSLDDFGTGYSSLSYLKRLPLDQLKVDQSFVRDLLIDPNDAAIAKTIVTLAESLGLGVIAEGVETEAQKDLLAHLGCHAYQGYLFSRPLPVDDFEKFVQRIANVELKLFE